MRVRLAALRNSDFARAMIAGTCGSLLQFVLMWLKAELGLLSYFQPAAQIEKFTEAQLGGILSPAALWVLSFVNAAFVVGLLFARVYRFLPGRSALAKGLAFGLGVWTGVTVVLFPLLGLGPFGWRLGHGMEPALFMLTMMLTYSISFSYVFSRIAPVRLVMRQR